MSVDPKDLFDAIEPPDETPPPAVEWARAAFAASLPADEQAPPAVTWARAASERVAATAVELPSELRAPERGSRLALVVTSIGTALAAAAAVLLVLAVTRPDAPSTSERVASAEPVEENAPAVADAEAPTAGESSAATPAPATPTRRSTPLSADLGLRPDGIELRKGRVRLVLLQPTRPETEPNQDQR